MEICTANQASRQYDPTRPGASQTTHYSCLCNYCDYAHAMKDYAPQPAFPLPHFRGRWFLRFGLPAQEWHSTDAEAIRKVNTYSNFEYATKPNVI
jgi:hypothetical protein